MRIAFFSKGDKSVPSSRYRAYYLAEALAEMGHETSVTPVTEYSISALFRYLRQLLALPPGSIIFLQRTIYNKYFYVAVLVAYLFGRRFIFDIDDAIYEHSPWKTALLARLARSVTCGSEFIERWARQRNAHTLVLENGLPLSIYTVREHEPGGVPVIGWIGNGPAHYENLATILPVLETLSKQGIVFRFRLIGAVGDSRIHDLFAHLPEAEVVDSLNWSDPREAVQEIQKFSVGIMPLSANAWNQAKYFKALEYMACGVPVVASPCDALKRVFSAGGCGMLAATEAEWTEKLSQLLNTPALRQGESSKCRMAVEQRYSTTIMGQSIITLVKQL